MTAQHFEVKKHAVRQTADGWVMSFVVHPADMSSEFAIAPLGTRYMLALAEIGDDETPAAPSSQPPKRKEGADDGTQSEAGYLGGALRAPGERAVVRAALLPKDPMFRRWLIETKRADQDGEDIAIRYVRAACGVLSRAELATNGRAAANFKLMENTFWAWRNGWNEIPE